MVVVADVATAVVVVDAADARTFDRASTPTQRNATMTADAEAHVVRAPSAMQRTDLPNGLTVLSEAVPGVRSVAFGAWVRAATLHEQPTVMGVSHFLEHMVFKGTTTRTAQEIALSLETLGGSLDAYTEREHTSFQARVLDEHLPIAADVIADIMFRPVLRDADLALERKVILEEISMVDDTPDDVIFDHHNRELWGEHPHGYPKRHRANARRARRPLHRASRSASLRVRVVVDVARWRNVVAPVSARA